MLRQYELVDLVKSYDPDADEDALNRAYVFAMKKHGAQLRTSGDPYYSHPVEVAGILTKFKLDSTSIIAGLLHDTVEDTDTTVEEIKSLFGEQVAQIVDGLTKLAMIEQKSAHNKQAENFRKLLLAMSEDIRVLLIKLADRLHNMRTLHFCAPEKRMRIARETLDIYAPLAERIGMQEVKSELEEIAFAELHKEAYESIKARLNFLREQGSNLVPKIIAELQKDMEENGIKAQVSGREKTPYSIWRKMQSKNASFEQLSDIMAFRIIVDDVASCYQALGIVHSKYHMVPRRFKDYISTPKPNGYKSIHTGIIGPENTRIEVQIRTAEMHEVAEKGVAAHWAYKQGERVVGKNFRWIRELLEILEQASNPEEFLENTKLEMYNDQVFCFTPKGDLIGLPINSTPVDFAYAVHSSVGDTCVGAKINGEIRPLRTILQNGDQVEILTSKAQHPSTEWDRFVVTGKAKAAIRRYVRQFKRDQFITLGQQLLERTFKGENLEFNEKALVNIFPNFEAESIDDIYAKVGEGLVTAGVLCFVARVQPEVLESTQQARPMEKTASVKKIAVLLLCLTAAVAGGLSLFASQNPDGLEWAVQAVAGSTELEAEGAVQEGAAALQEKTALMPDYDYADGEGNGTSTAGVVGSALTFTLAGGVGLALAAAKKRRAKQRAAKQG